MDNEEKGEGMEKIIAYSSSFGEKDTVWGERDLIFSGRQKHWDPKRESGFYKVACPIYGSTLWMDGNYRAKDLEKAKEFCRASDKDILIFKAIENDCIYEEASAVIELELDDKEVVEKQMRDYQWQGFPEHYGMVAASVIFRRDNERVRAFNDLWWDEIEMGSRRDQLSFNYTLWWMKNKTTKDVPSIGYWEGNFLQSELFERRDHVWKGRVCE